MRDFYKELEKVPLYGASSDDRMNVLNLFYSSSDFKNYERDYERDKQFLLRAKEFLSNMSDCAYRNRMANSVGAVANGLAAIISPFALVNLVVGGANLLTSTSIRGKEDAINNLLSKAIDLLKSM